MGYKKQYTEIVYVCTPNNYEHQLFSSIRSLIKSNSHFDKIVIFCVGRKPKYWEILELNIEIVEVENLEKSFFMFNKLHCLTRNADRLIFIDTDTLILNPLDLVYENVYEDFIGRQTSRYSNPEGRRLWDEMLLKNGFPSIPYFNTGFFIFQNNSHSKILDDWKNLTYKLLESPIPETVHSRRNANQIAFSLALAKSSLSYKCMSENQHYYAWVSKQKKANFEKIIVYHTGGRNFSKKAVGVEVWTGLAWLNLPRFKYSPSPIHYHRIKVLLTHLKVLLRSMIHNIKNLTQHTFPGQSRKG